MLIAHEIFNYNYVYGVYEKHFRYHVSCAVLYSGSCVTTPFRDVLYTGILIDDCYIVCTIMCGAAESRTAWIDLYNNCVAKMQSVFRFIEYIMDFSISRILSVIC